MILMDIVKLFITAYLIYLFIDGILRLLKFNLILAEFGIIITIKGIGDFIKAIFQKVTNMPGAELNTIDYYMPGGIEFIDKPINPDVFYGPPHRLRLLFRIILKPTILIDYCGSGITIFSAIQKGSNRLSSENINLSIMVSLLKIGFTSSYHFGPPIARNLPILANLIRIIEYHVCLIRDVLTGQRDINGAYALTKIVRLSINYLIIYYALFYILDSTHWYGIGWLQ